MLLLIDGVDCRVDIIDMPVAMACEVVNLYFVFVWCCFGVFRFGFGAVCCLGLFCFSEFWREAKIQLEGFRVLARSKDPKSFPAYSFPPHLSTFPPAGRGRQCVWSGAMISEALFESSVE